MSATKNTYPTDIAMLHKLLAEKDRSLEEQSQTITQQDRTIIQKETYIAALEEFLRLEKLRKFGARSEKSANQQDMFNEAELAEVVEEGLRQDEANNSLAADQSEKHTEKPKTPRGRKPLPAELPRVRIEHGLPEVEQHCPCGCQRSVIGEEASEQLDIIPAKVRVLVHVRKKYACPACEEGVITAPLPPQPIAKSNASPGLLAHIAVSKYQDALPLYRQEVILKRSNIDIPRNTLGNWMIKAGVLIQPLLNLLEDQLLSYPVLHCDETTVQVLKEPGKEATSKSYMWVRVGGPPTQPIRLFHYADNRGGDTARHLLAGYQGYVQTDDYAGYNGACSENNITQLGCWAHARRKFVEAQKANTKQKGKATKASKADMAISLIQGLYRIEKQIKDLNSEQKHQVRQEQSVAQLNKIREWLDKTLHTSLPKGLLGKAIAYLDKNWSKLTVYTEDGRLNIDNNPAENAIRPFVVGRKNWLFSATVSGAKSSANLYGLIETAKANGLEPYQYLKTVFAELPKADMVEKIEALLPWRIELQDGVY